ncbi:hypothetical protein GLYMA_05G051550v4 [Glycine max]|nr:hypothetical protein GLYMA_05G051550v4 [Glycine max]KAH1132894.1 hypothetical protein GYH30_011636 [Glycine max]
MISLMYLRVLLAFLSIFRNLDFLQQEYHSTYQRQHINL